MADPVTIPVEAYLRLEQKIRRLRLFLLELAVQYRPRGQKQVEPKQIEAMLTEFLPSSCLESWENFQPKADVDPSQEAYLLLEQHLQKLRVFLVRAIMRSTQHRDSVLGSPRPDISAKDIEDTWNNVWSNDWLVRDALQPRVSA